MVLLLYPVILFLVRMASGGQEGCRWPYGIVRTPEEAAAADMWPYECDRCHLFASNCSDCFLPSGKNGHHQQLSGSPAFDVASFDVHHQCHRRGVPSFGQRTSLRKYPRWFNESACWFLKQKLGNSALAWFGDSVTVQFRKMMGLRCVDAPLIRGSPFSPSKNVPKEIPTYQNVEEWGNTLRQTAPVGLARTYQKNRNWSDLERGMDIFPPKAVLVVNMGLHFKSREELEEGLRGWARSMLGAVKSGRLSRVAFAETAAQHFDTKTGGYWTRPEALAPPIDGYPCVPASFHNWTCETSFVYDDARGDLVGSATAAGPDWRNAILHRVASDFAIPVARLEEVTKEFWDLHPGGNDCTHFCYSPGLIDAILYEVATAIGDAPS